VSALGISRFFRGEQVCSKNDVANAIAGVVNSCNLKIRESGAMELLTISPARSIFSNALNFCRRNAPLVRSPWRYCPRNAGGPRLAPRHATSPHIGISRSRASFLNNELRGSEHDPRNERERARIQQEMEDESGHGTLPITTQSPRSSATGLRHS
jgi:hypothetical protein